MERPILVTGGTGRIGRRAVALLRAAGHDVRVLTRHPGPDEPGVQHVAGDTVRGHGVEAALDGVDVVLHVAGGARGDDVAAARLATAAPRAAARPHPRGRRACLPRRGEPRARGDAARLGDVGGARRRPRPDLTRADPELNDS